MFTKKSTPVQTGLEEAIERLHAHMQTIDPDTEQYANTAENLTKLYKLREHDAPRRLVSPDNVLLVAGNLLGIAIIVGHERAHIVTSKALTFVQKLR